MPTWRAAGVVAAVVALYVAASLLHYEDLGLLAGAGIVALVVGVPFVLRRPELHVERRIEPGRVERGKAALGSLTIVNLSAFRVGGTTAVEPCGAALSTIELPRLRGHGTRRVTYGLPTDRRAVLDVGPLTLVRQDPLGLWRSRRELGGTDRLYVYPRVHPLKALPAGRTRSLDGPDSSRSPQGSITFHALREYVVGDDLRHVHWKSLAHLDRLMVREHVDTSIARVTLVLDTAVSSFDAERFEEAVEVAASVAAVARRCRFPVRLMTTDGLAAGAGGKGAGARVPGADRLFEVLAGVARSEVASVARLVRRLGRERRADLLVAVTGTLAAADLGSLARLARHHERSVIAVIAEDPDSVPAVAVPNGVVIRARTAADFAAAWNVGMHR